MDIHMTFSDPIKVVIPEQPLGEFLSEVLDSQLLQLSPKTPDPRTWGLDISNVGPRTLRLGTFDRDMLLERELEAVHKYLLDLGRELALIEDILAIADDSVFSQLPRGLVIACLGSPVIFNIEPEFQSINTRTQSRFMRFVPYNELFVRSGSCVLVAEQFGKPSPRSKHFPFANC